MEKRKEVARIVILGEDLEISRVTMMRKGRSFLVSRRQTKIEGRQTFRSFLLEGGRRLPDQDKKH